MSIFGVLTAVIVLPAYAGMIRTLDQSRKYVEGAPRIRGDDPDKDGKGKPEGGCSPHTRG